MQENKILTSKQQLELIISNSLWDYYRENANTRGSLTMEIEDVIELVESTPLIGITFEVNPMNHDEVITSYHSKTVGKFILLDVADSNNMYINFEMVLTTQVVTKSDFLQNKVIALAINTIAEEANKAIEFESNLRSKLKE